MSYFSIKIAQCYHPLCRTIILNKMQRDIYLSNRNSYVNDLVGSSGSIANIREGFEITKS